MAIEEYSKKFNNLDFAGQEWREIGWYSVLNETEGIGPLCEMAFDSAERYKKHDDGLIFFLKNGYTDDSEWIPFTVEDHPKPLLEFNRKISLKDYLKALKLVSYNQDTIKEHADIKTGTHDFFTELRKNTAIVLNEMPNLPPKETGLPYGIWVDKTGAFKKGGHWMRIKVIKEKGDYAVYTIPDHQWIGDDGMKAWQKHMIEKFVEYNEDDFVKLFLGQITQDKFIERMVVVNDRGEAVNPEVKNEWFLYKDAGFGYKIVINSFSGQFNYMNKNGDIMLPKNMEECSQIIQINGKPFCSVNDGEYSYTYQISNHTFTMHDKFKIN